MTWLDDAECKGLPVDLWFESIPSYVSRARWLCSICPSQQPCLEQAVEQGDKFGMRAGVTPWERRQMRAERAAA